MSGHATFRARPAPAARRAPAAHRFALALASVVGATVAVGGLWSRHAAAQDEPTWELFRRPNANVEEGNRRLAEENWDGAIQAYADAANELPESRGVRLNRGLALLGRGDLGEAEQALMSAIVPPVDDAVRADAYYNLGLLRYRQGDAASSEEDFATAREHFTASVGHLRRALRARPGNRDAAFNLELALRRLNEARQEEERQEEERQQQEQDQPQDGQNGDSQQDQQDQQGQDGDSPQDQNDPSSGEDEQQEQDGQDETQDSGGDQDGSDGDDSSDANQPSTPDAPGEEEQGAESDRNGGAEQDEPQDEPSSAGGQRLPQNVQRQLDALQDGEQSLERVRAAARGRRDNRRVEQDW